MLNLVSSGSEVWWNNTALKTTFVSNRQLTAIVLAEMIASPGTAPVRVYNPGGLVSNAAPFTIGQAGLVPGPALAIVTRSPLPDGTVGTRYLQMLTATGGLPPILWSVTGGALPPGLALTPNGELVGIPTTAGSSNFTATATDRTGATASSAFSLTISPGTPPPSRLIIMTPSPLPTGTVGVAYSQTLTATGGTPPLLWSLVAGFLPPGLTLAASTGVVAGTPTTLGVYPFIVRVTDGAGTSASKGFAVVIEPLGLTITTSSLPTATVGSAYSQTLTASGGALPLRWTLLSGSLPPGLTLNETTGLLSGVPTAPGLFRLLVRVTDAARAFAMKEFVLIVNSAGLSITTASLPSGTVGVAYSQTFSAAGGTPPLRWAVGRGELPPGLALDAGTGRLAGIPRRPGVFELLVGVVDSTQAMAAKLFSLTIEPRTSIGGLLSGAAFRPWPVAPGAIVTLFGLDIGPPAGVGARLNAGGLVDNVLAETRVLFDGVPAPLIFVEAGQINCVAPYSTAGKTTTEIEIEFQGGRSTRLTVPVAESAPAIFTMDASGAGQGAILNQDGSLNSSARPAAKGSIVVLFATGEGQTDPPGTDGKLAQVPAPKPRLPVAASIGGLPAEVLYAGGAPGLVAGVFQVNVRVPEGAPSGPAVPILLTVGGASGQPGVTLAVR